MATIVNTPPGDNSNNNLGTILGLLALAVLAYLFFVYGLPAIRSGSSGSPSTVDTVPESIDVNITQQPQPTSSGDSGVLEQNINIEGDLINPTSPPTSPTSTSGSLLPTSGNRIITPVPTQ